MRRADQKYVDHLRPGDRFMWCERLVEVEEITGAKLHMDSPSRWVGVKLGDEKLHLHYYDHELVSIAIVDGETP